MNAERELESVVVVVRSVLTGMGIEWFGMVWYGLVWFGMVLYVVLYCVLMCNTVQVLLDRSGYRTSISCTT